MALCAHIKNNGKQCKRQAGDHYTECKSHRASKNERDAMSERMNKARVNKKKEKQGDVDSIRRELELLKIVVNELRVSKAKLHAGSAEGADLIGKTDFPKDNQNEDRTTDITLHSVVISDKPKLMTVERAFIVPEIGRRRSLSSPTLPYHYPKDNVTLTDNSNTVLINSKRLRDRSSTIAISSIIKRHI